MHYLTAQLCHEDSHLELQDYLALYTVLVVIDSTELMSAQQLDQLLAELRLAEIVITRTDAFTTRSPVMHIALGELSAEDAAAYVASFKHISSQVTLTDYADYIVQTAGGNPLAIAAGMAVMEAVANEPFLAEVREKGERLRAGLEQFIGNYPELFELVRGKGLMLGVKMKMESRPFYVHLRDHHQLLTVAAGDNTIRIIPPLVIGDAEIDEFFDKLSAGAASFKVPEPA